MPEARIERPRVLLVTRCFVRRDEDNKHLLIKRAACDTHHPGLWEVPGGKLEQGQDVTRALEDEALQETGLLVHPSFPLSYYDSYPLGGESKYAGSLYLVLFGITRIIGGKLKLSHEHDAYAWADYDEMLDYELTPEVRKAAIILEDHLRVPRLALVSG